MPARLALVSLAWPILLPIATGTYGVDPVHFRIVMSINFVLGLLTPPAGAGLLIACQVTGEPPLRVFRAMLPFVAMTLAILVLLPRAGPQPLGVLRRLTGAAAGWTPAAARTREARRGDRTGP